MGILSLWLFIFIELVIALIIILDFGPGQQLACLAHDMYNMSALGDPGMRDSSARFGLEAWNSCNEVGMEAPNMGSPRMADCADLDCPDDSSNKKCEVYQYVKDRDNGLRAGNAFPSGNFSSTGDVDNYAVQKEKYLGSLCALVTAGSNDPWYFWMIMLKNGNLDKNAAYCPENGKKVDRTVTNITFPCFGRGCMNQPLVYRNESRVVYDGDGKASLAGGFYGTYDLHSDVSAGVGDHNSSFFAVTWQKNSSSNSWIVSFKLTTSPNYPWLMLYLRSDAAKGFNGGYHYDGRGMMRTLPESPYFTVKLTLDIKKGGGGSSQFYLTDIGGCWKNNGDSCDGDVTTDVTRYSEMIINPSTGSSCGPHNLQACPSHHINTTTGETIHRSNTSAFPYSAYHYYCAPGNAEHMEEPSYTCDPYSNPQAQELVQILPHPEWAVYGYPKEHNVVGWESGPRSWELDTGALSSRLYFYQDPGTSPARRIWRSINCGTEIYFGTPGTTVEWSVSDFDVLVPKPYHRMP